MKNVNLPHTALDELDKRILWAWDFDARQSAAEIAKRIGSNKDTVNYRIKRLLENQVVVGSFAELNTAKFGYSNIKTYFQFHDYSKRTEKRFFEHLASIPQVGWIVSCSGKWDVLFCFWARSSFDYYSVYKDILKMFAPHILQKEVIHNINWFYYNRKWLNPGQMSHSTTYEAEIKQYKPDKLDAKILSILARNGRISIVEIADATKQSSQTVLGRIKKLEQNNVITKYSLMLNYKKLGMIFCKAFLYLKNMNQQRINELYRYCANEPNIFALTTTLGAWDVELELEVENFEQLREIMDRIRIQFNDIIKNYESVIIMEQSTPNYIVS